MSQDGRPGQLVVMHLTKCSAEMAQLFSSFFMTASSIPSGNIPLN